MDRFKTLECYLGRSIDPALFLLRSGRGTTPAGFSIASNLAIIADEVERLAVKLGVQRVQVPFYGIGVGVCDILSRRRAEGLLSIPDAVELVFATRDHRLLELQESLRLSREDLEAYSARQDNRTSGGHHLEKLISLFRSLAARSESSEASSARACSDLQQVVPESSAAPDPQQESERTLGIRESLPCEPESAGDLESRAHHASFPLAILEAPSINLRGLTYVLSPLLMVGLGLVARAAIRRRRLFSQEVQDDGV